MADWSISGNLLQRNYSTARLIYSYGESHYQVNKRTVQYLCRVKLDNPSYVYRGRGAALPADLLRVPGFGGKSEGVDTVNLSTTTAECA